jgi:DNA-binding HxlR family transcriptional regulator
VHRSASSILSSLDFVGDRWTILILRELLGGPARFQELRNGLPGIAPNL